MPLSESFSGSDPQLEDVLTLGEAATYLRVSEDAVRKMADQRLIPAQKIGDEWRFLRKALNNWMTYGEDYSRRPWAYPPEFLLESAFIDELLHRLEKKLLSKLKAEASPKPGSKEAVRHIIGIFKGDDDLEERLADARKRREAT